MEDNEPITHICVFYVCKSTIFSELRNSYFHHLGISGMFFEISGDYGDCSVENVSTCMAEIIRFYILCYNLRHTVYQHIEPEVT